MEKFRNISLFTLTAAIALAVWPVTLLVLGCCLVAGPLCLLRAQPANGR